MTALLQMMDKVSQNLYAELMLREVGRFSRHQGTREAGLEEMDAMMHEIERGKGRLAASKTAPACRATRWSRRARSLDCSRI